MREELKLEPCPFCGGVDLKTYRNLVECQNLDCGVCGPDMGMLGMSEEGARQVAITAWNTRAKPPQGDVGADSGLAAADDNWKALVEVVEAARDLVMEPGGLVNRGVGVGLVVVEKADKSDPHYRLCTAFEKLAALAAAQPPQQAASAAATNKEAPAHD